MANELDDLREFIVERLTELSASIDTSEGSRADALVIQPILERLSPDLFATPIESFIISRLRSEFPGINVEGPGDPLNQLMVKPLRAILEPFRRQLGAMRATQSLADPSLLSTSETSRLLANWFDRVHSGAYAVGTARVWFSAPRSVTITPFNTILSGSGLEYYPVDAQSISADQMIFQSVGSLFYFDVRARAANAGSEYNIERDELASIEGVQGVVRVSNPSEFVQGAADESPADAISRVRLNRLERTFMTSRGTRARVTDEFSEVLNAVVVGFGDPEMERDVLTGGSEFVYGFGLLTANAGTSTIHLAPSSTNLTDGSFKPKTFESIGLAAGDVLVKPSMSASALLEYTVTEVLSPYAVRVTPAPATDVFAVPFLLKSRARGILRISDIPGGIVLPQTLYGEIEVASHAVHVGGKTDTYVRTGDVQSSSVTIQSLSDDKPLFAGLNLETFGADTNTHVTYVTGWFEQKLTTDSAGDTVLLVVEDGAEVPWSPVEDSEQWYLDIRQSPSTIIGTFPILAVLEDTLVGSVRCRRVQLLLSDVFTAVVTPALTNLAESFDYSFRVGVLSDIRDRVRNNESPVVNFASGEGGIGSEIGDSVLIETGIDAGAYTARGFRSWIAPNDTILLRNPLVANAGELRYRINDEIQLDLIEPKIPRIPMADLFTGLDLRTVAGGQTVFSLANNFVLAGVQPQDTLRIFDGPDRGDRTVVAPVLASSLTVQPALTASNRNLRFEVFKGGAGIARPLIRVQSIDVLNDNNEETGVQVPYGDVVDARVLGGLSDRAQGVVAESFRGSVIDLGIPTFEDLTTNFVAKGVLVGMRLELLEGVNAGEYEITGVGVGSDYRVTVLPLSQGGADFVELGSNVHYRIGQPSAGVLRMYFEDPTSVEIQTGPEGGRLEEPISGARFRFSSRDGHVVFPDASVEDSALPSDLHVLSITGTPYTTDVLLTDEADLDLLSREIRAGDLLEVFERVPFLDQNGDTLSSLGIFGQPAGLATQTGSVRVSVPENSAIDFTQMGDLVGQDLEITEGPDAGLRKITKVISPKILELDRPLLLTTLARLGGDTISSRVASIVDVLGTRYLTDAADLSPLSTSGRYVRIFESGAQGFEGLFQIGTVDIPNNRVELVGYPASPLPAADSFSWVVYGPEAASGLTWQPFRIFSALPKQLEISEVAPVGPSFVIGSPAAPTGSVIGTAPLVNFSTAPGVLAGVVPGDRLELLRGPNQRVYRVDTVVSPQQVTVATTNAFSALGSGIPFKVWSGLVGHPRSLRVIGYEGSDGRIEPSAGTRYRIRRPNVYRVATPTMADQSDAGLYYADIEIESVGPGRGRTFSANTRMELLSGVRVDGYTYTTQNPALSFSMYEQVSLNFDRRVLPGLSDDVAESLVELGGRNLKISYLTSPTVGALNTFIRSDEERVKAADPIVKHFLPTYVYTELSYTAGRSVQDVTEEIQRFLETLQGGAPLSVSELERIIRDMEGSGIRHPITLVGVTHGMDRRVIAERSADQLGSVDAPYRGSPRITAYYALFGDGFNVIRR